MDKEGGISLGLLYLHWILMLWARKPIFISMHSHTVSFSLQYRSYSSTMDYLKKRLAAVHTDIILQTKVSALMILSLS